MKTGFANAFLFLCVSQIHPQTEATTSRSLVLVDKSNGRGNFSQTNNFTTIVAEPGQSFLTLSELIKLPFIPNVVYMSSALCWSELHSVLSHLLPRRLTCSGVYDNNTLTESTNQTCCARDVHTLQVSLAPSTAVPLSQVIGDVMHRCQWTSATVFHDNTPESRKLLQELTSQDSLQVRLSFLEIRSSSVSVLASLLVDVFENRNSARKNVLLICSQSTMINLLSQASQLDDRSTGVRTISNWLVILPQSRRHVLEELPPLPDNVAVVSYTEVRHIMDLSNKESRSNPWKGYIHTLMYQRSGRRLSTVATFNIQGEISWIGEVFPNTKNGFNGRELIASTKQYNPFVFIRSTHGFTEYKGLCIDLLHNISAVLNFTVRIIQPPDGQWGTYVNGSWDGLIRQLQFREVDLVVAPLTVREDRESVMDFTYPYFYDSAGAIFKRPDIGRWMTLLRPLSWKVLMCLGVVVVSSTFILFIAEKLRATYLHEDGRTYMKGVGIFEYSFWYIWGSMLKYGSSNQPSTISGSILVMFVSLFCIIVSAAYSGNLIAILTIMRESVPFKTSTDIIGQSEYKWGTINGSLWQLQIANSNDSDFRGLWEGMMRFSATDPDVLATSSAVHKKKVEQGNYVFFSDRSVMDIWAYDNCQLSVLHETFRQITYGVGLPNHSPYLDMFSKVLMDFEKAGLRDLLRKAWWPEDLLCREDQIQVERRVMEIADLQGAFYVLFIGISISGLVLLIENIRSKMLLKTHFKLR